MTDQDIICSDCENFVVKERSVNGKATPEQYGYCVYYEEQASSNQFYSQCPGASRIVMVVKKPFVKGLAPKGDN